MANALFLQHLEPLCLEQVGQLFRRPHVGLSSTLESTEMLNRPVLMPHREAVELVLVSRPVRQMSVHQRYKAAVMAGLEQVHQLVDDDVLETHRRLFGEVGIKTDASPRWGATPPPRLHSPDNDVLDLDA